MKKLLVGIMVSVLLIGVIGLIVFIQFKPFGITSSQSSQTSLIQERVVELSELTTWKYEYSKAMVNRDDKKFC